jgi:hypothetical protein
MRARRLGWLAPTGIVLAILVLRAIEEPDLEGDTVALVEGAAAARACIARGITSSCPDVLFFPLFQYLPSLALGWLGASDDAILRTLAAISTAAFPATLLLAGRVLSRVGLAGRTPLFVLVMLAGPPLFYLQSSFGEMLALFLVTAFLASVALRAPWPVVALTLLLAGITKETALPFLLVLAAGTAAATGSRGRGESRRLLAGLAVGAASSIGATAGFNHFRFGTLRNPSLLQDLLRTPGFGNRAHFFAGQWLSPSGGVWVSWPVAGLALVLAGAALLALLRSRPRRFAEAVPCAAALGTAVGLTLGFSLWHAPLGWIAWGPRFLVPWLPALTLVVLLSRSDAVERVLGGALRRPRVLALLVAAAVFGWLTTLGQIADWSRVYREFFYVGDATCPRVPITIQGGADEYYRCMRHYLWTKDPMSLSALRGLASPEFAALGALGVLAIAALVAASRQTAGRGKAPDVEWDGDAMGKLRAGVDLADLIGLGDREFLGEAYRAILSRRPEPAEHRAALSGLRSGELTQLDIVHSLVHGPEGRQRRAEVDGLSRAWYRQQLQRRIARAKARLRARRPGAGAPQFQLDSPTTAPDEAYSPASYGARVDLRSRATTPLLPDPDLFYRRFEEEFRGDREEIRHRLSIYLPFLQESGIGKGSLALDLGPGRGEWLELLTELGLRAYGVDGNREFVREARERGLDVRQGDGVELLASLETDSHAVLSAFHVIEHLSWRLPIPRTCWSGRATSTPIRATGDRCLRT